MTTACAQNTTTHAAGGIRAEATSDATIHARIRSASTSLALAPLGGGKSVDIGAVMALNKVSTDTEAHIADAAAVEAANGDILVTGADRSFIQAIVPSSSIAVGVGINSSMAVSVGFALARNEVDSDVSADIERAGSASRPVFAANGDVIVRVDRDATISAEVTATAIAVAAGFKSAPAVGGDGALAFNAIYGDADAYILDSAVVAHGSGTVAVTATDASRIEKVLAAAVSVAVSGKSSPAVAVGLSVARNVIGAATHPTVAATYTTDSQPGVLKAGDTVRITSGALLGNVYQYIGPTLTGADAKALATQNYGDRSLWTQVNLSDKAAGVLAYLSNTSVDAAGALLLTASSDAVIEATVLAGAVAAAASAQSGVAVSAAGVYTDNTIRIGVRAYAQSGGGLRGGRISVTADDASRVHAVAGAASLLAALGGTAGLALSAGVSLADNSIDNAVGASIRDADGGVTTTSGDVTISASEDAPISVASAAASLAAGIGGTAGAGAAATNRIGTTTLATVENSLVTAAGAMALSALDNSSVSALIAIASLAAGAGSTAGVGVSVGASVARNEIGYDASSNRGKCGARAMLVNSSVTAGGRLSLTAIASQTIRAEVLAGSVAVAGGGVAGAAAVGSGVSATHSIAEAVEAAIHGDGSAGIHAASLGLDAEDTSTTSAIAGAASLSASLGGTSDVALSIGVALAKNDIANTVEASIGGADDGVTTTSGDLTVTASEHATITVTAAAASLAAGLGGVAGIAVSGELRRR